MVQIKIKPFLAGWGANVRFSECRGFPRMQSFMRESPLNQSRVRPMIINDDDLELVAKAVNYLAEHYPQQHDALFYRYVYGLDVADVFKKLQVSATTGKSILAKAEQSIELSLVGAQIRVLF